MWISPKNRNLPDLIHAVCTVEEKISRLQEKSFVYVGDITDTGIVDFAVSNVAHAKDGDSTRAVDGLRDSIVGAIESALEVAATPVSWNLTKPRGTGVAERDTGIEATGHGAGDEGTSLFVQQSEQALLLGDERIELGRLTIKVVGYGALLIEGRDR